MKNLFCKQGRPEEWNPTEGNRRPKGHHWGYSHGLHSPRADKNTTDVTGTQEQDDGCGGGEEREEGRTGNDISTVYAPTQQVIVDPDGFGQVEKQDNESKQSKERNFYLRLFSEKIRCKQPIDACKFDLPSVPYRFKCFQTCSRLSNQKKKKLQQISCLRLLKRLTKPSTKIRKKSSTALRFF